MQPATKYGHTSCNQTVTQNMPLGESSSRGNKSKTCKGITMDIRKALEKIIQANPEEGRLIVDRIDNLERKNIVALGCDEAFALTTKDGSEIKCFKQRVTLSKEAGTLIQPVYNGPWTYSATGFEQIAMEAGISVVIPSSISVGPDILPNPYIRENKNGAITAVHCRAVAFGFSSKGLPVVSDWSTVFDVRQYRLMDLLAKAKRYKHVFMVLPTGMRPEVVGTWAMYPYDESVSLWVDTSHEEGIKALTGILNREKKAIDFAQTFAKRNAVKHLLGSNAPPQNMIYQGPMGPTYDMEVKCWRPTNGSPMKWDMSNYKALKDASSSSDGIFGDKQIELKKGNEALEQEEVVTEDKLDEGEIVEVEHTEVSRTQEPVNTASNDVKKNIPNNSSNKQQTDTQSAVNTGSSNVTKQEPPMETAEHNAKTLQQLKGFIANYPEEFTMACTHFGYPEDQLFTADQAKAVMASMTEIIEGQM